MSSIAEAIGRRRTMMVASLMYIIGVIIQVSSTHEWVQYMMGRLVGGLGVGSLSVSVPMYQAETAPSVIRGTLTATYQLFITLGILAAYCVSIGAREIGEAGSWRTTVGVGLAWPAILSIGMIFMVSNFVSFPPFNVQKLIV
jgi:MFS transporter, SP family, sugar:H+ symporter